MFIRRFLLFFSMLGVVLAFLSVWGVCACTLSAPAATKTPTLDVTAEVTDRVDVAATNAYIRANNIPAVILTASAETVHVGEIVWVRVEPINLGMPQYTITLSPGGQYLARYGVNAAPDVMQTPTAPLIFEFVSPDEVLFGSTRDGIPLRALQAGSAVLDVYVSGEAHMAQPINGTPSYLFYFTSGAASITLTAVE